MKFYVYDITTTAPTAGTIYLSSSTSYASYFTLGFTTSSLHQGWNYLAFTKSDFTNVGSESWSNTMVRLRFAVGASANNSTYASFDELRVNHDRGSIVVITFDDEFYSTDNIAYPIMVANNQKGNVFVVNLWVGWPGRATSTNLTALYNAGWDLANHTADHTQLTIVSSENATAEIDNGYAWLISQGYTRGARFLAYPFGSFNDSVITDASGNCTLARTVNEQYYFDYPALDGYGEYQLTTHLYNGENITTLQGYIDEAITQDTYLILTFHDIAEATSGTTISQADFQTISDYIKTKSDAGLLTVKTLSEFYTELGGAGVTAPTVTTSAATSVTSTSALLNGQITDNGGEDPSIYFFYGLSDGGTNPAAWDYSINMSFPAASFNATAPGLSANTLYYFTVRGINSGGTAWGSTANFTTSAASASSTPLTPDDLLTTIFIPMVPLGIVGAAIYVLRNKSYTGIQKAGFLIVLMIGMIMILSVLPGVLADL